MLTLSSRLTNNLTTLLLYGYRTPQKVASFQQRIKMFNNKLNIYERQFHMRPPNLETKNAVTFPIKVPLRLRHRRIIKKGKEFVDNSSKIHWNRLTPNEILLAFENLEYLEYYEMMEGLKYLSEIKGQEQHNWNEHPWISKAMDQVDKQFHRIRAGDKLKIYYLMKKLGYSKPEFWSKMYALIEQNIYELYPSEFEKFFKRYYKVSDQYFSSEMKQKFLTLMENRLRSFSPEGIIWMYELFQEQNRLDEYWTLNVFIPLFKNPQYYYHPNQLRKIFRFMMVLGHEKDDRLYDALYNRLTSYQELTEEQLDGLMEVIEQIKDIFVTHRVNPYIEHLEEMRIKMKELNANKKLQIPIQELVRQDLIFVLNKRKLKADNIDTSGVKLQETNSNPEGVDRKPNDPSASI